MSIFPTGKEEIDSVILLNLDNETLSKWIIEDAYVRQIFKVVLDDYMKKYVHYSNRTLEVMEDKPYKIVNGIPYYGTKSVEKMMYYIDYDDERELIEFTLSLINKSEIVKMIIIYLDKRGVGKDFYENLLYRFVDERIYPDVILTTNDLMFIYSLAPKTTDWVILSAVIGELLNGWPLENFIPIFENMILAAKMFLSPSAAKILTVLKNNWEVYGEGYAEEASESGNEDHITLIKYIDQLLGTDVMSIFQKEEEEGEEF